LVQAPRSTDIQACLRDWLAAAPTPAVVSRVQVDIDPQSFL
jgi:primosomal protein N'